MGWSGITSVVTYSAGNAQALSVQAGEMVRVRTIRPSTGPDGEVAIYDQNGSVIKTITVSKSNPDNTVEFITSATSLNYSTTVAFSSPGLTIEFSGALSTPSYNPTTGTTQFLGTVITAPANQSNMSTVLLGSSTTSRCIYGDINSNNTIITWERIYGYWFHLQAALGSPFRLIGEFHATDQDTAAVNALIPRVIALKPAFCFYQPLANNLGSNQSFATCKHFAEEGMLELLNAGIKVVLVTSTPRGVGEAGVWSAAKGLEYSKFSTWAHKQQDKYREQVFVLDNWRQGVDFSATDGSARTNLLSSDFMHTWEHGCQILGRQAIGSVLENHLRGLGYPPEQWRPSANVERSVILGAGVSPNFVGANVAATGWTVSDGTGSLVATEDGAGNWLRITFNNNPESRLNPRAFVSTIPVTRFIVGHRYQLEGWLRTSEPVMGIGIRLRTLDASNVGWEIGGQADPGSSDVRRQVGGAGIDFKLISRTITLSQAAYDAFLALNAQMALQVFVHTQISADGTGTGAATFDIRDCMIRDLDA